MPGMIMLWYGSIVSIPSGWHLCDGTAGTIDLRNKFIVCAGDTYNPSDTGGSILHSHGHSNPWWYPYLKLDSGTDIAAGTDYTSSVNPFTPNSWADLTIDDADGRPPYKALCYIQKL